MTETVQEKAAQVADMMQERLSIRGADLAEKLRHTGRMMPRQIKQDAKYLAQAAALAKSAKLQRMIDMERAERAYRNCVDHLKSVDATDRRKGLAIGILSSIVFGLITVSALVAAVVIWRGLI